MPPLPALQQWTRNAGGMRPPDGAYGSHPPRWGNTALLSDETDPNARRSHGGPGDKWGAAAGDRHRSGQRPGSGEALGDDAHPWDRYQPGAQACPSPELLLSQCWHRRGAALWCPPFKEVPPRGTVPVSYPPR